MYVVESDTVYSLLRVLSETGGTSGTPSYIVFSGNGASRIFRSNVGKICIPPDSSDSTCTLSGSMVSSGVSRSYGKISICQLMENDNDVVSKKQSFPVPANSTSSQIINGILMRYTGCSCLSSGTTCSVYSDDGQLFTAKGSDTSGYDTSCTVEYDETGTPCYDRVKTLYPGGGELSGIRQYMGLTVEELQYSNCTSGVPDRVYLISSTDAILLGDVVDVEYKAGLTAQTKLTVYVVGEKIYPRPSSGSIVLASTVPCLVEAVPS